MSTLCATVKGVYCGATRYRIELCGGIYTLCNGHWAWQRLRSYALRSRGHQLGLGLVWCVPHSLPPPKKICVFLYSQIAGCFAVAGISFSTS
jgi:hypothetical protein